MCTYYYFIIVTIMCVQHKDVFKFLWVFWHKLVLLTMCCANSYLLNLIILYSFYFLIYCVHQKKKYRVNNLKLNLFCYVIYNYISKEKVILKKKEKSSRTQKNKWRLQTCSKNLHFRISRLLRIAAKRSRRKYDSNLHSSIHS